MKSCQHWRGVTGSPAATREGGARSPPARSSAGIADTDGLSHAHSASARGSWRVRGGRGSASLAASGVSNFKFTGIILMLVITEMFRILQDPLCSDCDVRLVFIRAIGTTIDTVCVLDAQDV